MVGNETVSDFQGNPHDVTGKWLKSACIVQILLAICNKYRVGSGSQGVSC